MSHHSKKPVKHNSQMICKRYLLIVLKAVHNNLQNKKPIQECYIETVVLINTLAIVKLQHQCAQYFLYHWTVIIQNSMYCWPIVIQLAVAASFVRFRFLFLLYQCKELCLVCFKHRLISYLVSFDQSFLLGTWFIPEHFHGTRGCKTCLNIGYTAPPIPGLGLEINHTFRMYFLYSMLPNNTLKIEQYSLWFLHCYIHIW